LTAFEIGEKRSPELLDNKNRLFYFVRLLSVVERRCRPSTAGKVYIIHTRSFEHKFVRNQQRCPWSL